MEEQELQVTIAPRILSVTMPDGWRIYGSPVQTDQLQLLGAVQVSGFVTDADGKELIPDDFELPKAEIDRSVIGQWDPIYENGAQKVYRDAVILRRTKEGKVTGNPTKNYIFAEDPSGGLYQKGNVTMAQAGILQGREYEITGEAGGFYRAENGSLWVKRGTGLRAYPLEHTGYNEGAYSGELTESGSWRFVLKKRAEDGTLLADSREGQVDYQIDGGVPAAMITISAGGKEEAAEQGRVYSREGCRVSISIPADPESGIKAARYLVAAGGEEQGLVESGETGWRDCTEGASLEFDTEGSYVVYVRTEDHAGNYAVAKSVPVVIDTTEPAVEIQGAEDHSANGEAVQLKVSCRDSNYRAGSLQVEIKGANGGTAPAKSGGAEDAGGAWVQFSDFPREKRADDMYTVTAIAEDLAGNRTEKTLHFSVNRFGSVYGLSEETQKALEQFYHQEAFPVTFLETNIDYVGKVQILCRKNGNVSTLQEGSDYTRGVSGVDMTWKQYRYEIDAGVFGDEGSYEVLLLSEDRASNSSDSQTQQKSVRFAIDHTPPECLLTGIEENQIYQTETLWTCIEPRDNGRIKEVRLYLDGREDSVYEGRQLEEQDGLIKWKASAREGWQRLQVYAADEAGNECWTEEIPFYVAGETNRRATIPPYEKTEKSARELVEEQKRMTQASALRQKSGELLQAEGISKTEAGSGEHAALQDVVLDRDAKTEGGQTLSLQSGPMRRMILIVCITGAMLLLAAAGIRLVILSRA